jgi:formate dehydrogenase beta subunit
VIVYRRTRDQMPAHESEAQDAEEEGIRINWLRTISSMGDTDLTVEVQELDEHGRPHGTGRFETLEADTVILALGQASDTGFLRGIPGLEFQGDTVQVTKDTLMTGVPGIFAGGDAVPSQRTVTVGVGHGKRAARAIDAWLRGDAVHRAPKHPLASLDQLNLWYFGVHDRREEAVLDPATRALTFDEVLTGLSPTEASSRPAAACRAATASSATAASALLPGGRRHQARGRACATSSTTPGARAAVPADRQCPVHAICHRHDPGGLTR